MESDRVVKDSAAAELARLQELEDGVWFDAERLQNPLALRIAVPIVGIALLTGWSVLLVRTGGSFVSMVIGVVGSIIFVATVDRLERRYATARPATFLPPARVFRKLFGPTLVRLWPVAIASGVLFPLAIDRQAAWWVFAAGCIVMFAATIVNASIINRLGLWSFDNDG